MLSTDFSRNRWISMTTLDFTLIYMNTVIVILEVVTHFFFKRMKPFIYTGLAMVLTFIIGFSDEVSTKERRAN